MKFFYFLAKKISYTFALAFMSILGGWLAAAFAYFLGTSFILTSYEEITGLFVKWFPWSVLITTALHYLHFGLLTPLKIPAFAKSLRLVNKNFHGDSINENIDDIDLRSLYICISDLPLYNTITAGFYTMLCGLTLVGFIYFDYLWGEGISPQHVKVIIRVIVSSLFFALILYAMSTYLISEIVTNRERATCYNELRKRDIEQPPRVILSLRFKFSFFIVLMVISLLTFAAMIQRSIFFRETSIVEIIIYLLIAVSAGIFLMILNTNTILGTLNKLGKASGEIASGKTSSFMLHSLDKESAEIEYSVLKMAQEIEEHRRDLEMKVEQRTEELQDALSDLKKRDDMIQKQLDMASIIQRSILPGKIDDWNELKFSVRYIAMDKIGGDFYDVYRLKEDMLGILVADVSGHGIPAALVTTMAKMSFGNACRNNISPRRIFQEVNQNILDFVKTQNYLTTFFITVDNDYNITYANASHQKAFLLRTEEGLIEQLDTNGLFIGAIEDARETYEEKRTKLNYGDRMVLYTDGIPEASNTDREEYSNARLEEIIIKNRHLALDDFTSLIIEDVQGFIGNAAIQDDITLLVMELAKDETIDIIRTAKKLIEKNSYHEAIDHLERGLSLYPSNKNLIYNLAKNYFRVNNFGKTIEYIEKYIKDDRRNKYAFYIGGSAFYMMMDYDRAIDYFDHSLMIDPYFVNALFSLGMAYKKNGQNKEAIESFEKVIDIDPENKVAIYELNLLKGGR